ncbi:protein cholesin [Rhinophrynus dorsalis]
MAKPKSKTADKNERKKRQTEKTSETTSPKKIKLTSEALKVTETAASEVETMKNQDLEDLTPEERRVLERKLKKERKKEEKRLKRESAVEEKKEEPSKPSACDLALQYLTSWSKKQDEWKFQKTRQTWLLMHMYDTEKVPDEYFKILLDYLGGLKGSARDTTVQKAEALMKEYDKHETQEESDLKKMSRIKEILQLLS